MFDAEYRILTVDRHTANHVRVELRSVPDGLDATLVVPDKLATSFLKGAMIAVSVEMLPLVPEPEPPSKKSK